MYEDYSGIFVVNEKISFPVRNENNDDIYIKVKKLIVGYKVMFEKSNYYSKWRDFSPLVYFFISLTLST